MRYLYLLVFLTSLSSSFSQSHISLTAEEKAYLFHIVRKSPILDTNIGRYFEYRGPVIRFVNKDINYDSIELIIMNQPEKLFIRNSELAKSPKGILAEAANKVALWELNKLLLAKREGGKELERKAYDYETFELLLVKKLPPAACKEKDGKQIPHPKIQQLLNPSLNFNDKKALASTYHFLSINDQMVTLKAINEAINDYVEQRSEQLFRLLGGQANMFHNELVAAGDGSSTSGLLKEREKDERGRWNRGLPKAVGLFPYQLEIKKVKKKEEIEPLRFATLDFETAGGNRLTNIHADVWGYNDKKQTTVVIEKNGLSYHLFGSEETRFLSPDSSFASGKTFQSVINELEHEKIGKLDEMIHGKKGYDYWIDYYTKKRDETEMKIEKDEMGYIGMSYTPVTTSTKAPRKVKKDRRKKRKSGNNQPIDYQPNTKSGAKKRGKKQKEIVDLYNEYEMYKRKIRETEEKKQKAIDLRAIYQQRLDRYRRNMGYSWATFTEKDGLYTFQDSSTFDIYTQEFTFPPSRKKEAFEVRLLAIPSGSLSDNADEVMLHVNVVDAKPAFDARLQIHLDDAFASNQWKLGNQLIQEEDSVAVQQLFEALQDKRRDFEVVARGQGVGVWNGVRTVKMKEPKEIPSYPGSSKEARERSKRDSSFARLRVSEAFIFVGRSVQLEVNSYTDQVSSDMEIGNEKLLATMQTYKLTKNDLLSAYRSAEILKKLKAELNVLAGKFLPRTEASQVIDRINKQIDKTRILVGETSFKLQEFE
ncbi:MAG: hypothetical protein EP338_01845 [Bacteroidetes bacterium]|nr:MAG: hypothetical protein EP338_01845 [Bacteroidota bacterium]